MSKLEIIESGGSTYYNGIEMPHTHPGVKKGEIVLSRNWYVSGSLDGMRYEIWVREGFRFDGASIPRMLWRLCGHPLEAPRLAAALAHDWLYRSQVTSRAIADDIFNRICKDVGMTCWRTGPEFYSLRLCGRAAWRANSDPASIEAAKLMGGIRWHV